MRLRAVVLTVLAVALLVAPAPAQADPPLLRVMTVGDSVTEAGLWQVEFCHIVELETDFVCDLRNVAVGATTCAYWPSRIGALMAQHQPDLVVFACGTNDSPSATIYGEPETSWAH